MGNVAKRIVMGLGYDRLVSMHICDCLSKMYIVHKITNINLKYPIEYTVDCKKLTFRNCNYAVIVIHPHSRNV